MNTDQTPYELTIELAAIRAERNEFKRQYIKKVDQVANLKERIEELEAALRWEAGEECLHAFDGVECLEKHGDESPDLWCQYCRIIGALGEKECAQS